MRRLLRPCRRCGTECRGNLCGPCNSRMNMLKRTARKVKPMGAVFPGEDAGADEGGK